MWPRIAADATLVVHLLFIGFALFGALFALRWRWVPALQLPAAAWGIYVELSGGICPLTPLENSLRGMGGQAGYAGSFVESYLLPIIYPTGLTSDVQVLLAAVVLLVNLVIYGFLFRRRRTH
jgi:hypothetical protein